MPGYDGTGPQGRGPMTGRGNGYCILEISNDPRSCETGFAGLSATPVVLEPGAEGVRLTATPQDMADIREALVAIERDLGALTTTLDRSDDRAHSGA